MPIPRRPGGWDHREPRRSHARRREAGAHCRGRADEEFIEDCGLTPAFAQASAALRRYDEQREAQNDGVGLG
jgi:hypothetical protein